MKSLEKEVREYCSKMAFVDVIADVIVEFISQSKWVQSEKIKTQIDCWEKALKVIPREDEDRILLLVDKLKQQLKELEQ